MSAERKLTYIRNNAQVEVGSKRIHFADGSISRAVTISLTLFSPYSAYRGDEVTWSDAHVDELLAQALVQDRLVERNQDKASPTEASYGDEPYDENDNVHRRMRAYDLRDL